MPEPVRRVVEHLDLACYGLEEPTTFADQVLTLTHINPVIAALGFGDHQIKLARARQLCVPVGKNAQPIPEATKKIVRWVDFLKYDVMVPPLAPIPPNFWLKITHMNPLFAGQQFWTELKQPSQLMVPVAKDGHLPPAD